MPVAGREAILSYTSASSPLEAFLEVRCVREVNGFVSTEDLWEAWEAFREEVGAEGVARGQLVHRLVGETAWGLQRHRRGNGGARGVKGMVLRALPRAVPHGVPRGEPEFE